MAKTSKKSAKSENKYYSKLQIFKATRFTLGMIVSIAVLVVGLMLDQGMHAGLSWITIGLPICLSLSCFILYPATEEWEYQAWQAKPQRYEQHFKN